MQWQDTIASQCRYGDIAGRLFGNADIIFERSSNDYQGFANVLALLPDGRFCHYEWTYGSCSGCDEWESRSLTDEQIEQEMRKAANYFTDRTVLRCYLHLEDPEAKIPTANSATNGSIPGMMRFLCGESITDLQAMADAFSEWEKSNTEGVSAN